MHIFGNRSDTAANPAKTIAAFEAACPMPAGELNRLRDRRWILSYVAKGSVGAEIGVFRGHFAEIICELALPRKLYLVDPWRQLGETYGWGQEYTNFGKLRPADARDEAMARCARHPATEVVVIEDRYPACRDQIPEPLDFAYLDASHAYATTKVELQALNEQVKPGGLILGDDWAPDPQAQHHGVFRAVQEFVRNGDWQILAAGPGSQWILRRRPTYG